MNHPRCRKFGFFVPFIVLAVLALASFAVFGLWNAILPTVLGVKTITYWQAAGILLLAKILFGGFPGRRGGPPWRRHEAMQRWDAMTPEQRERMREEMRQRMGDWPRPPWCAPEPKKSTDGSPAE
jgi:Ca2+/H+ antiporter, TMEM165/GDT1 family